MSSWSNLDNSGWTDPSAISISENFVVFCWAVFIAKSLFGNLTSQSSGCSKKNFDKTEMIEECESSTRPFAWRVYSGHSGYCISNFS